MAVDVEPVAGYPLVPLGRRAPSGLADVEGTRELDFPTLGWSIKTPVSPAPTPWVYDVYYGLTHLFLEAGSPENGQVPFSRYRLLLMLGWTSPGKNTSGGDLVKPAGRHYRQLEAALRTLVQTSYVHRTAWGEHVFRVLRSFDLQDDETGRKPAGADSRPRSLVVFSPTCTRKLRATSGQVKIDLDQYSSFSAGSSRALYRTLATLRHRGLSEVSLEALFEQLGSTDRRRLPSVARKKWAGSHCEAVQQGVLTQRPAIEKNRGEWTVYYTFPRGRSADTQPFVSVGRKAREPGPGYLYIMTNPSYRPGLIKLGETERHPDVRASDLFTTGVPEPFQVRAYWRVIDCYGTEQAVHALLADYRQRSDREFFDLTPDQAMWEVQRALDRLNVEPLDVCLDPRVKLT